MKKFALPLALIIALTGCASSGSVGNYAIGDDNVAINAGRNRDSAQISRAQLDQHRRQRQNVSEELALEREKRANAHNAVRENLTTGAATIGIIGGAAGLIRSFRH
ncbi:MAG: NGK_0946 family protein [Eikenella corrodens]|jgi:putative cheA signal transduction histidine kinase|uniref:NGK_0946 family protein n=1 Tax=Eikenella corrodens TaxID=539 RepID=UPI0009B6B32C|nr:hypothetical protein [Eikenella corrodens]MDU1346741.1 hypothetical protein [Eikenella corrodens]MDU4300141.1 hypothetical protein [Eikenella corrodens]UAK75697.1 hypothetical protein K8P00_03930 [Eikenella corrodens]